MWINYIHELFSQKFLYAEILIPLFAFSGGALAAVLIVYLAKSKMAVSIQIN